MARLRTVRRKVRVSAGSLIAAAVVGAMVTSPYLMSLILRRTSEYRAADADGALDTLDPFLFAIACAWGGAAFMGGMALLVSWSECPPARAVRAVSAAAFVASVAAAGATLAPLIGHVDAFSDQAYAVWGSGTAGAIATVMAALGVLIAGGATTGTTHALASALALMQLNKDALAELLAPPAPSIPSPQRQRRRRPTTPPSPTTSELSFSAHRSGLGGTVDAMDIPGAGLEAQRDAAASFLSAASFEESIAVDPLVAARLNRR